MGKNNTMATAVSVGAVLLLLSMLAFPAAPQGPLLTKDFSWSRANRSIFQPTFSHSGLELAFSLQYHIPDGHEAEEREGVAEARLARIETHQRLADPVILILRIDHQQVDSVDYGWDPCFSLGDSLMAYAFQQVPISGKRVLAQTLEGNPIKIYNRRSQQREMVASPAQGFLLEPAFANGSTLWYKLGGATNGAYGGAIGARKYDLRTERDSSVFAPKKHFGLPTLLGTFQPSTQGLTYLVWEPRDNGYDGWMANEYKVSLRNLTAVKHSFGKMGFKDLDSRVAIAPSGDVIYLDDQHELRSQKDYLFRYHNGKIASRKLFASEHQKFHLSPNGNYALISDYDSKPYLLNTTTFAKTPLELPDTEIYQAVWSENSKRLAVVQALEDASQDTDVVSVFTVR